MTTCDIPTYSDLGCVTTLEINFAVILEWYLWLVCGVICALFVFVCCHSLSFDKCLEFFCVQTTIKEENSYFLIKKNMDGASDPFPVLMMHNESFLVVNDTFEEALLRSQQPWRWSHPQAHPDFKPYWFEAHDNLYWRKYIWEHPTYPYIACVLYLLTIFGIQAWMKDRPPFKLRTPLILWNWGLGLFSIFGFYRIGQEFANLVFHQEHGLHKSICEKWAYH